MSTMTSMKRIVATPLWFLVGWFVGSMVAWNFGLSAALAPISAFALAAFVVVDPAGLLWARSAARTRAQERLTASSAHN
jgi:hypothetical protein